MPSNKIHNNVIANLVGIAVTGGSAIVSAPLIYRLLGPESYGLIGLYILLQTFMPFFDAGITAGLARAVAWHNGKDEQGKIRTLVHYAHFPISVMVLVFFIIAASLSDNAASRWGEDSEISFEQVQWVFWLICTTLGLRMFAALNRAVLMALEYQVKSNVIQGIAAFFRTLGALLFTYFTGTGVLGFFALQPVVSLLEWLATRYILKQVLIEPYAHVEKSVIFNHLRFSFSLAGLSMLWLVASQIEKIVLTDRLSLAGFGAYSLGVHIASVTVLAAGTINGAILPRMTRYASVGKYREISDIYGISTVFVIAIAASICVGIYLAGSSIVPSLSLPVMGVNPMNVAWLYSIGCASVAIMALAYQLQNALGKLRLHAIGTITSSLLSIPALIWAAHGGDVMRTAYTFVIINWGFTIIWLQVVHRRFLPGGAIYWMKTFFLPSILTSLLVGTMIIYLSSYAPETLFWGVVVLVIGVSITLVSALLVNPAVRDILKNWRQ